MTKFLALLLACTAMGGVQPLAGAHRGLAPGQPENTLAAFNHAIDLGVAIIELDLRTTADGAIVVMHDPTVDRTTDGTGSLSQLSFDQVRRLDAGGKAGLAFAGQRVPSYDEVLALAAARPVRFLLDIKDGEHMDIAEVIARARARGVADRIVIGVRRLQDLRQVRAIDPGIATLAFASRRSDIDGFIDGGAAIVRLWSDWVTEEPGLPAYVRGRGKAAWILVGRSVPRDPAALAELHRRLRCADADAVITDWPGLLLGEEHQATSR